MRVGHELMDAIAMLDDCSEVLLFMACLFPAETPPKRGQ